MRGIMRRINANVLLWLGLMAWAFGSMLRYIGWATDWNPLTDPSTLLFTVADYSSLVGAGFLFVGAAIKAIASLNSD